MNVTDPIADMLTRIRNAIGAGLKYATVPASTMKIEMTKVLEAEGLIRGFRLIKDNGQGKIKIAKIEPLIKLPNRRIPIENGVENSPIKLSGKNNGLGENKAATPAFGFFTTNTEI